MDEIDCSRIALKHYMADRGAQSNLALDAKISEGYISQLINKRRINPSRRTMTRIAAPPPNCSKCQRTLAFRVERIHFLCTVQTRLRFS